MHISATCNGAGYRKENVTNKENSRVFKVRPDFSNLLKMANLLFSLPGVEFLVTAEKFVKKEEEKSAVDILRPSWNAADPKVT